MDEPQTQPLSQERQGVTMRASDAARRERPSSKTAHDDRMPPQIDTSV